ncbi:MAG: hypothetical protein J6I40_04740 [Mailhella sp.]|nr:hypothetical protein [Mailhella sp.]
MKKMLLLVGVTIMIAGALSLLYAALNLFGFYHVLDGSAELYISLHRRMIIFGVTGIFLVMFGAICFIIRSKV